MRRRRKKRLGGVELRHRTGEAAEQLTAAVFAKGVEDLVEDRAADGIDRQIDAPGLRNLLLFRGHWSSLGSTTSSTPSSRRLLRFDGAGGRGR